ncbi:MAG: hypothetical protein IJM12_01495 [Bacteroidales bacterium]|nr:hypothetical protein [Bacteroidales bacterium]
MKCLHHILVLGLLIAVMVRCGSSPDSPALTGTTSQSGTAALEALEGIDSLMWKQPDSALTVMLKFAASPEADSLDKFEGHYCQMLISELLYKNYYEQSNREELLKAVDYFDSIVAADRYKKDSRRDAPRASAKNVQNIAFLDARAHYIDGVGYYENGDVVNACEEYLKTLEVMEAHFEEKELVGHKARFMSLTYGRLGEIFSRQFMMESAITCYENALVYCKIEPTSPLGISNFLYRIGKEYDKKDEIENARLYYSQALETMTITDNMVYRDIVASKAFCEYKVERVAKNALDELSTILMQANTENERLNRYFTIGCVYFYDGNYDSALFYFEPVFANKEDIWLQTQSASYLRIIYDSIGHREQSDAYMRFLTNHKKPEGENKALVSKLEDMFKNYQNQKQERQAKIEREKAIKKTLGIIIPIIVVVLVVYFVLILRNKKQQEEADRVLGETKQEHEKELRLWQAEADRTLEETEKKYEEELEQLKAVTKQRLDEAEKKHLQYMADADERHSKELREQKDHSEKEIEKTKMRHQKELEAERLAYQKEREKLQLSLQLSKRNVDTLQEELGRKRTDAEGHYEAFLREPVCVKIIDAVRDLQITTRKPYTSYCVNFDDETLAQFGLVVSAYYGEVKPALLCLYPSIAQEDLLLCYLYLLGMENKQIAVVRQREYSTVRKQAGELKRRLGIDESVRDYVLNVAGVKEFVEK